MKKLDQVLKCIKKKKEKTIIQRCCRSIFATTEIYHLYLKNPIIFYSSYINNINKYNIIHIGTYIPYYTMHNVINH